MAVLTGTNHLIGLIWALINAPIRWSINLIKYRSAHAGKIGSFTRWCHHPLLRCLWSRRRPRAGSDPHQTSVIDPGTDWSISLIRCGKQSRERSSVTHWRCVGVFLQVTERYYERQREERERERSLWALYKRSREDRRRAAWHFNDERCDQVTSKPQVLNQAGESQVLEFGFQCNARIIISTVGLHKLKIPFRICISYFPNKRSN